ncbi:MAG: hypothetical protein ACOYB5_03065 [Patescibacteria group bacterium]|jgi:outer membrane murein-binding lipoprotein Lpp|nr:hypothetical protein [Candidatus Moranbacteria bacterium]
MIKIQKKSIVLISAVFLAAFVFSGCGIGGREEAQNKINSLEEQNRQQQEELEKLKSAENARTENEQQAKKTDCEQRLKNAQDSLADSQRKFGEYQVVYDYVKNDACPKEKTKLCETICYSDCLKDNGCTKSSCSGKIKDECRKRHEKNLDIIGQELRNQTESVKRGEIKLQSIKDECAQYLN